LLHVSVCCKSLASRGPKVEKSLDWRSGLWSRAVVSHTSCWEYGTQMICIFGLRKKNLAGKRFATDAEVKQAVTHVPTLPTYFFYALVPRWDKCLNTNGDNAEAWCVPCAIHVTCILRSKNNIIDIGLCVALRFEILSIGLHLHYRSHEEHRLLDRQLRSSAKQSTSNPSLSAVK